MNEQLKNNIFNFLHKRTVKHCAIATVDKNGKPECAVMGYAVEKNLSLICMTDSKSRKWKNMKNNSSVAVAIGWEIDMPFLQYEGTVKLITNNDDEYKKCEKHFFADHPHSLQYKGLSSSVFYKINPVWIKFVDLSVIPVKMSEIQL